MLAPWLSERSLTMIHAARGAAKTRLGLSVGYALANGQDLLRWKVEKKYRVLYVDGELPGPLLQKRLKELGRPTPNLHVLSHEQSYLNNKTSPDIGTSEGRSFLDRLIKQCDADLVILDSLSTLARSGVENDAESWTPIQEWLMQLRWDGRSVLLIHHDGKSGSQRGTSKREDVLDTVIQLKKRQNDTPQRPFESFDLIFTKSRDFYGEDAEPMVLTLSTNSGKVEWEYTKARHDLSERIKEMEQQKKFTQREIADELGISQGRVSQIKKALRA